MEAEDFRAIARPFFRDYNEGKLPFSPRDEPQETYFGAVATKEENERLKKELDDLKLRDRYAARSLVNDLIASLSQDLQKIDEVRQCANAFHSLKEDSEARNTLYPALERLLKQACLLANSFQSPS